MQFPFRVILKTYTRAKLFSKDRIISLNKFILVPFMRFKPSSIAVNMSFLEAVALSVACQGHPYLKFKSVHVWFFKKFLKIYLIN